MKQLILAFLIAATIVIITGPILIPLLKRLKFGQSERDLGPQSHLVKSGTPTMGGIMFIVGILVSTLALCMSATELVLPALLMTCGCGVVGFLDDFLKVKRKNTAGLRAYQKIIAQFCIALIIALYAYKSPFIGSKIYFAFFDVEWDMGIFYIPFIMFVVIAIVNSVNLTDGLDGLASGVTLIYSLSMMVIFYYLSLAAGQAVEGQAKLTQYSAELNSMAIFCAAVAGGCLGFLRFNAYPARVFMGDTGSLALGGAISVMVIFSRSAFLFLLMGGCFVASAVSVVLQVGSYKLRHGKRIFKMAPLHHHFELLGYSETRIVAMYMIVTTFLCLISMLAYV